MSRFFQLILEFFQKLFDKKDSSNNIEEIKEEETMKITESLLPVGPDRPGTKLIPTSITIHWIGPYSGQVPKNVKDWWNDKSSGQASAHYVIKDDEIICTVPPTEVAWHAGCTKGNTTSIGIENIPQTNVGMFSEKTINTLTELCTMLHDKYPTITLVVRHYDWTKKDCPRYYTPITSLLDGGGRLSNPVGGEERWKELKKRIAPWSI